MESRQRAKRAPLKAEFRRILGMVGMEYVDDGVQK
jgi:hypothetical protein